MIIKLNTHIDNYTVVDNDYLRRDDLSWAAKGLLTYLLSLPEEWNPNPQHLKNVSSNGISAVRTALDELIAKGYAEKKIHRNVRGSITKYEYIVKEIAK